MKKILDWKTIISISLCVGFIFLVHVVYSDYVTLPSQEWSKGILIYQSEKTDQTDQYYNSNLDATVFNNELYLVFADKKRINFQKYDESGTLLEETTEDIEYIADNISFEIVDNTARILLFSEQTLEQYDFDLSTFKVVARNSVDTEIDSIKLSEGKALFMKANELIYFDGVKARTITSNSQIEEMSFVKRDENIYISLLEYNKGAYLFSVYDFDTKTNSLEYTNFKTLSALNGYRVLPIDIAEKNKQLYLTYTLKQSKTGENSEYDYILSDALKVKESYEFKNWSYEPETHFVEYKDEIVISFSEMSFIGKTEVGSQNKFYKNIYLRPVDSNGLIDEKPYKILTKTKYFEPNSKLIKTDDFMYLLTNEVTQNVNSIYLSSNNPVLISKSLKLNFKDWFSIILGAITYIPMVIFPLMLIFISMLFPVIVIIMPIAIFKINWIEKYPKKMLIFSLTAYFISKIYYVVTSFDLICYQDNQLGMTPFHLNSTAHAITTLIITSAISIICLITYLKKKPDAHFIKCFLLFYLVEMAQYAMYITLYQGMFM